MALTYTTNLTMTTYPEQVYNLKTALKAVGWTVPRSSDGTTYSSSSDNITHGSSGANGMNNSSAWFVIAKPSGGKYFMFQRNGFDYQWTINVSRTDFSGGTPNSTTPSTSTDGQSVINAATLFGGTANSQYQQIIVDSADPYGFISVAYPFTSGGSYTVIMMDPLLAGTYPAGDTDPFVYYAGGSSSPLAYNAFGIESSSAPKAWLAVGTMSEGFQYVSAAFLQTNSGQVVGLLPVNSITFKDDGFPVPYLRRNTVTSPYGYKGQSSLIKWLGTNRSTSDTMGAKSRLVIDNCTIPWDGVTTPAR